MSTTEIRSKLRKLSTAMVLDVIKGTEAGAKTDDAVRIVHSMAAAEASRRLGLDPDSVVNRHFDTGESYVTIFRNAQAKG